MRGNHHIAVSWGVAAVFAALAVVSPTALAEDDPQAEAASKAIQTHDPDKVDPNTIRGEDWTFDFQFEHPHPIVVRTPGGEREVYWYLVYTVTNRAKEAKHFVPSFVLYTDKAVLRRAGIFPTVYEAIKASRKIRFLQNAVKMHGKIMPGEGGAQTGVAIFAPLPRDSDRFAVFCEGMSGRYIERPNLVAKDDTPADEKVVRLHKTLALTYRLPGDKWWLNLDQPVFISKSWTWR